MFVSTACWPKNIHLLEQIRTYQEFGINQIELGAGVDVRIGDIQALQEWQGVDFLIHNYFPPPSESFVLNLASASEIIRKKSIQHVKDALHLSKKLNAPFYSVHAGFITDPVGFDGISFTFPPPHSKAEKMKAMERFIDSLQNVLVVAKHLELQILVENNVCTSDLVGKLLLQEHEEFLELFANLKSDNLGILLDTGHLNVSAHTLGFDRLKFIEQIAQHVHAFHIHENDGYSDTHQPIEQNSWVLDVLGDFDTTDIFVVLEAKFSGVKDIREHYFWLNKELQDG